MKWLLLLLLACPVKAENPQLWPNGWSPLTIDKWGGLNLLQDSSRIDGDAQQAINVLTDNTYLEKRPGNVRLATILSGFPVSYLTNWYSPGGTQYLIAQASTTIYQTNFSGNPVLLSTIASGFNLNTVAAFSKMTFADGYRATWYWDGNSTGTITDTPSGNIAPTCTYLAFKDARIWCANLPNGFSAAGNTTNGGGASTVLLSSSGGNGYWSVPPGFATIDNAPNRFDLNPDDGEQIGCLAATPWGMFVGKPHSTYMIKGTGNLTYYPRILDPKIGCVDNRSVQMVYGVLVWLAADGIYAYNGAGQPQLMTRELDPLMAQVRETYYSQGQWATQLRSDWQAGTTSSPNGGIPINSWDFNSIPGQIFPSSATLYDDNRNPVLQGGAGFSSDTLVGIDTTTFPLNTGLAQLAISTTGVSSSYIWVDSFPTASYTSGPATWTIVSAGAGLGFDISGTTWAAIQSGVIYTVAGENVFNSGLTYAFWHFDFECTDAIFFPKYENCSLGAGNAGNDIINYNFMQDGLGNYYQLNYAFDNSGTFTQQFNIIKHFGGVNTTIGSSASGYDFQRASVTITRDTLGNMAVYVAVSTTNPQQGYIQVLTARDTQITSSVEQRLFATQGGPVSQHPVYPELTNFRTGIYGTGGTITSRIYDMGTITPVTGNFNVTETTASLPQGDTAIFFYVRSSTSPNNDLWTAWHASSNTDQADQPTMENRYWQYQAQFYTWVSTETPTLNTVSLDAMTTGYYYSKVNFLGSNITSWRQFSVTEANPGTYGYSIRVTTYSFPAGNTSIPWNAQTANQIIGVATGTYAQFRLDSTALTNADKAEPITGVFVNWNNGVNLPASSSSKDRRYMACVTVSTTATSADTCLIRQKNGKWVQWSNGGTIGAMGIYNQQMIAGDGGTSSNVWSILQPNVYNDDGAPISATWIGADEDGGLPFNPKDYYGALVDALPVQASSVTFSYQVNKSSGFVSTVLSLDSGQASAVTQTQNLTVTGSQYGAIDKWIPASTGYAYGNFLRYQFSDNNLNDYFRVNSLLMFIHTEPWNPQ